MVESYIPVHPHLPALVVAFDDHGVLISRAKPSLRYIDIGILIKLGGQSSEIIQLRLSLDHISLSFQYYLRGDSIQCTVL